MPARRGASGAVWAGSLGEPAEQRAAESFRSPHAGWGTRPHNGAVYHSGPEKETADFPGDPADARAAAPCVECGAQETGRGGGSKHPVGGPDPPRKLPSCLCCRSSGIMFPDLSQIRDYVPGKGCRLWVSEVFLIRKTAFSAHSPAWWTWWGSAFYGWRSPSLWSPSARPVPPCTTR